VKATREEMTVLDEVHQELFRLHTRISQLSTQRQSTTGTAGSMIDAQCAITNAMGAVNKVLTEGS
jgi:hypothetical protein